MCPCSSARLDHGGRWAAAHRPLACPQPSWSLTSFARRELPSCWPGSFARAVKNIYKTNIWGGSFSATVLYRAIPIRILAHTSPSSPQLQLGRERAARITVTSQTAPAPRALRFSPSRLRTPRPTPSSPPHRHATSAAKSLHAFSTCPCRASARPPWARCAPGSRRGAEAERPACGSRRDAATASRPFNACHHGSGPSTVRSKRGARGPRRDLHRSGRSYW